MCALWLTLLILAPQCLDASRMVVAKKVKNDAPLEQWEKELCVVLEGGALRGVPKAMPGTSSDAGECRKAIALEDAHCHELEAVKIGRLTHADFDSRCKSYKQDKARIKIEVEERVEGGNIRKAAEACEPEVEDVCVTNLCPIMCFLKDDSDCDCKQMCKETANQMWKTGSMDCEDKKFSECQEDLHNSLKADGRYPALEALMREHTVKCMCVAWRSPESRKICYQGGKGIKPGSKWCQFTDTRSWTDMLNTKLNKAQQKDLPQPNCTEFPGNLHPAMDVEAMNQCLCGWAAPKSALSLGIVAGLLFLVAASFEL